MLLSTFAFALLLHQPSRASSPACVVDFVPHNADEAAIVRLDFEWCEAAVHRQAGRLARVFADDVSWVEDTGYRNKDQVLHRYMIEVQEHIIELRDVRMRRFGDVIVQQSHIRVKKTVGGKTSDSEHTAVDVFQRRGGRWQLVVE